VTRTGTVAAGRSAPVDLQYRKGPPEQGDTLGFVLVGEGGQGRTQVVAVGPLAEALWKAIGLEATNLHDHEATVTGNLERVAWKKDGKDMPPYRRLTLERIETEDFVLPSDINLEVVDFDAAWKQNTRPVAIEPKVEA
jgi:hypothetical protein